MHIGLTLALGAAIQGHIGQEGRVVVVAVVALGVMDGVDFDIAVQLDRGLGARQAEAARDVAGHDGILLLHFDLFHTLGQRGGAHGGRFSRSRCGNGGGGNRGRCRRSWLGALLFQGFQFSAQTLHFLTQQLEVLGRLSVGRNGQHGRGHQGQGDRVEFHDDGQAKVRGLNERLGQGRPGCEGCLDGQKIPQAFGPEGFRLG